MTYQRALFICAMSTLICARPLLSALTELSHFEQTIDNVRLYARMAAGEPTLLTCTVINKSASPLFFDRETTVAPIESQQDVYDEHKQHSLTGLGAALGLSAGSIAALSIWNALQPAGPGLANNHDRAREYLTLGALSLGAMGIYTLAGATCGYLCQRSANEDITKKVRTLAPDSFTIEPGQRRRFVLALYAPVKYFTLTFERADGTLLTFNVHMQSYDCD